MNANIARNLLQVFLKLSVFVMVLMVCSTLWAYQLPNYQIPDNYKNISAEEALSMSKTKLDELGKMASLTKLKEHSKNSKVRLGREEKKAAGTYIKINDELTFWKYVTDLKSSLVSLHKNKDNNAIKAEADTISRSAINTLYQLSQKWRVGNSAIFRNMLIGLGKKEKGFCYHYVDAIRKDLSKYIFEHFEVHWGVAWGKTFRENNALIITAKGKPFATGIAIDAWRTAGRPFWTQVKGDRFPWVEEFDVVIE